MGRGCESHVRCWSSHQGAGATGHEIPLNYSQRGRTGGLAPSERTSPAGLLVVVVLLSGEEFSDSESGEPVGTVNIS
jgi:hypothetical protein